MPPILLLWAGASWIYWGSFPTGGEGQDRAGEFGSTPTGAAPLQRPLWSTRDSGICWHDPHLAGISGMLGASWEIQNGAGMKRCRAHGLRGTGLSRTMGKAPWG